MRFNKLIISAALFLAATVLYNCPTIIGQVLQPKQANQQVAPKSSSSSQKSTTRKQKPESAKPYKLSSRFHLQKGANTGYLVVKVELPKGSFIYSLTQKAPLRPSKIRVTKSNQFRLKDVFTPDRPANVIKNDPIFKQRLEKHSDVVQFFAPIEIVPGTDVTSLASEITFSGQVCTEQGFCLPIMGAKTKGRFAGYFERSAEKRASSQNVPVKSNQPR